MVPVPGHCFLLLLLHWICYCSMASTSDSMLTCMYNRTLLCVFSAWLNNQLAYSFFTYQLMTFFQHATMTQGFQFQYGLMALDFLS